MSVTKREAVFLFPAILPRLEVTLLELGLSGCSFSPCRHPASLGCCHVSRMEPLLQDPFQLVSRAAVAPEQTLTCSWTKFLWSWLGEESVFSYSRRVDMVYGGPAFCLVYSSQHICREGFLPPFTEEEQRLGEKSGNTSRVMQPTIYRAATETVLLPPQLTGFQWCIQKAQGFPGFQTLKSISCDPVTK